MAKALTSRTKSSHKKLAGVALVGLGSLFMLEPALAAQTIGDLASNITGSFGNIVKLITAICYVAGIGFAAAGIMKFKQHKDNPTQVPLGGPVAMIFIAAALIWLPGIIQSTGQTVFNDEGYNSRAGDKGKDPFGS